MNNMTHEEIAEKISSTLLNQLIAQSDTRIEGLLKLKEKISNFVRNQTKIKLLLPAFPCKTNNSDKVLGHRPDIGEYLVLRKFVKAIRDIQAIYDAGITFYIFSDYHTFSDYIAVDLAHHYTYADGLKEMVRRMNASDSLKIVNFEDFDDFAGISDTEYFTALKEKFGDKDYESQFAELKLSNSKMNNTYLGLKKFMNQDQKHILAKLSYKAGRERLAEIAKGMMVQGKALDNFLQKHFADCIRLSIHEHPMTGEKYSLYLFDEPRFKTPWHSTMMYDAHTGFFLVDTLEQHLQADGAIIPATYQDQPWCLIRLTASTEQAPQLKNLRAQLQSEKFGLILESNAPDLSIAALSEKELIHLVKEFGTVTLRGFKPLSAPEQMNVWHAHQGAIPSQDVASLDEILATHASRLDTHSTESLSIGWNLVWPSIYKELCQEPYPHEDLSPNEFALHCHCRDTKASDSGITHIIIDSALASLIIDGKERETLRHTSLKYERQDDDLNICRGVHPLIIHCPQTQQETLRWWKPQTQGQSASHRVKIETSRKDTDIKALEERLLEICLDPRVCIEHNLLDGDWMLFSNHTTLQGLSPSNAHEHTTACSASVELGELRQPVPQ